MTAQLSPQIISTRNTWKVYRPQSRNFKKPIWTYSVGKKLLPQTYIRLGMYRSKFAFVASFMINRFGCINVAILPTFPSFADIAEP